MKFYDCDEDGEFDELKSRVDSEDLVGRNGLQAFAPDTPEEAINRGYSAATKPPPHHVESID
jgi:hypothetical protein